MRIHKLNDKISCWLNDFNLLILFLKATGDYLWSGRVKAFTMQQELFLKMMMIINLNDQPLRDNKMLAKSNSCQPKHKVSINACVPQESIASKIYLVSCFCAQTSLLLALLWSMGNEIFNKRRVQKLGKLGDSRTEWIGFFNSRIKFLKRHKRWIYFEVSLRDLIF